jgi:hypothetical protein
MLLTWLYQPEGIVPIFRGLWLVILQDLGQAANMLLQEGK